MSDIGLVLPLSPTQRSWSNGVLIWRYCDLDSMRRSHIHHIFVVWILLILMSWVIHTTDHITMGSLTPFFPLDIMLPVNDLHFCLKFSDWNQNRILTKAVVPLKISICSANGTRSSTRIRVRFASEIIRIHLKYHFAGSGRAYDNKIPVLRRHGFLTQVIVDYNY